MAKRIATVLGVLVLLGGVVGLGCSDSDEEVGAFSDLLRFVPDEGEFRERVTITDLAAIRDHLELEPADGIEGWMELGEAARESNVQVLSMYSGVLGAEDHESLLQAIDNWERGFGFGLGQIDRIMAAGFGPPRWLYAVGGRLDAADVEQTLAGCGECEPHEVLEHAGQRYFAWGEGLNFNLQLRGALPAFDAFGRGGLFVFADDHVLRANWEDGLTSMIDAGQGRESLGGDAAFAAVARAGDELGLFTLVLTDVTQDAAAVSDWSESWQGNPRFEEMVGAWTPDAGEVLLRPYLVLAAGRGIDDAGAFTALMLSHGSEEDAAENVGRLEERIATTASVWSEQPWRDVFDRVEVTSDGVVLIAKLRGPNVGFSIIEGKDPLLLHE